MTWLEPFIWALASVFQKYFLDRIKDKNARLAIAVWLSAIWVIIYNLLIDNWFESIIWQIIWAIWTGYFVYKKFLSENN
jgi:drug/metabolite transporter (DMT)-like permease